MAVYDAGIASEDYGGCVLMKRQRARCANIQGFKKIKCTHESHWPDESYRVFVAILMSLIYLI